MFKCENNATSIIDRVELSDNQGQHNINSSQRKNNIIKLNTNDGTLGVSVNIIPLSVVERIGYMQIEPYAKEFQMEDKTCMTPVGTVKDVLIQIDKFSFSIGFVIFHVKIDPKVPLK